MTKHEKYMQEALKEANVAFEKDEVPVGAVIVFKGQIIGRAHNQIKTLKDPTAHAEMIAITQASSYLKNERLKGCEAYVTIEPCPMCAGAMVLARIKNLFYATERDKGPNHKIKVKKGLLKNESRSLIQEFFKRKRESPSNASIGHVLGTKIS